MRLNHARPTIALGLIAALAATAAQATNGYMPHGFGTKSKGMAGAGSALPQDAMIGSSNVAGTVWVGRRMDAGLAFFAPSREYTQKSSTSQIPGAPPLPVGSNADFTGTVESEKDLFLIPHFAYSHPLDEVSALGAIFYGNGGMNTTYNQHDTTRMPGTPASNGLGTFGGAFANPPDAATGIDLMQVGLNLNYSRKLADNFSVGAGLILASQMFKAKGLSAFGQMVADGNPDNLSSRGRDTVFGWGALLGAMWHVNDQFSLGLSYQSKIDFGRFDKYSDLLAEGGDMDAPATLNFGLAFKPRNDLTFVFDIQHIWYGDVRAFANEMTEPLARCMAGDTRYCLGNDRGPGFGWQDMTVYKLGVQWDMRPDWTLRAGYSYGEQPIDKDGVMFNVLAPGLIEQHFTLGLTKRLNKQAEVNLAAMYAPQKDLDCGCRLPFSGGPESINIAMDQWEFEVGIGYRW